MLSDSNEFFMIMTVLIGFISWNIVRFWKARAKNAETELSQKRMHEIFQEAKNKVMDTSLSGAIDLGNDYVSKHSADYGNKKE